MKFFKLFFIVLCLAGTLLFLFYFSNNKQRVTHIERPQEPVVELIYDTEANPFPELYFPELYAISKKKNAEEEPIETTIQDFTPHIKKNIPNENWVWIWFDDNKHYPGLNAVSKALKWPLLKEMDVPVGSLEVRVWISGDTTQVLRLLRNDGEWTGFYTSDRYLDMIRDKEGKWVPRNVDAFNPATSIFPLTPKTNWESLWKKLDELGILTLPDDSTFPNNKLICDGMSYVLEINDGVQYRTYMYGNPQSQEYPEAENIIQIIKTLSEEFSQSLPKDDMFWYYQDLHANNQHK